MDIARFIRTPALLLGLVALLIAGLTLPAQAATKTGAVKGVVTLDGKPLKGVRIELFWTSADGYRGPRLGVDTTNSKGAYSFSKFPLKNTRDSDLNGKTILIKDPSRRIVDTSRRFRDRAGKTVTRNASVKKAASITGSVTRGDGVATARLRTDVFGPPVVIDPSSDINLVYDTHVAVAKSGAFALRGLPAGDYYLRFADENNTYFSQCYDNLPAATTECNGTFNTSGKPDATKITVTAGQNVALTPQVLSVKGRRISGTVTDTSGRPIRYARVAAVQNGRMTGGADESAKNGSFTVGPLTDGSYRLRVRPKSPWAPQTASTLYGVNGQDLGGVQIKLKSRASIKATLTPGKGTAKVAVDITRSATGKKPSGTVTIRWGTVKKTVSVVKGKATVKLSGLSKGRRTITVAYSGTSSTAPTTETFHTTVK
jgi:hypothetical protein